MLAKDDLSATNNEASVMRTLNHLIESKVAMNIQNDPINKDDDLIDSFPKPRYFQAHFQHIHENTHHLQNELAQLKSAIAQADKKIERLLALLSNSPYPK